MVISSGEGWGAGQGDVTTDPRDREVEPQTPGLGTREDVEEEENRKGVFFILPSILFLLGPMALEHLPEHGLTQGWTGWQKGPHSSSDISPVPF